MEEYININGQEYQKVNYVTTAAYMPDLESITYCASTKPSYKLSGVFTVPNKQNNKKVGSAELINSTTEIYIKEVIYNDPATIILWSDGTKTVTKCAEGDIYSAETGLSICILKKLIGGAKLYNIFSDWLPTQGNRVDLKHVRNKYK